MTYKELQDQVLRKRFGEAERDSAKLWLLDRYGEVWQYADWPVKESGTLGLTVTNGVATVPLPAGFSFPWQSLRIYDENGYELSFLRPDAFYRLYEPYTIPTVSKGPAQAWTFTTELSATPTATVQIRVGPTPDTDRTYQVRGWSLPVCRDTSSAYKIGGMSDDDDRPWWPDDFHFWLVPGAQALGLKLENDPTWPPLQEEFERGLELLARAEFPVRDMQQVGAWGERWL